jgi:hypothetical protein
MISPPTKVRNVAAMSVMRRPNWLAFSRSMRTCSSGFRLDKVVSTSAKPGFWRNSFTSASE